MTAKLLPGGEGTGTTYAAFLAYYDSGNLTDIEHGWHFSGVRLPQFCRHLASASSCETWPFELRLLRSQLFIEPARTSGQERAFLSALEQNPGDDVSWGAYSDWLEERGDGPAGTVLLRRALERAAHFPVATICNRLSVRDFGGTDLAAARQQLEGLMKEVGLCSHDPSRSLVAAEDHIAQLCLHTDRWGATDLYHQWILFDDLWASAHPALARAILRQARRWDVLTE
jgi:uncharacterized protein (TIGR02996 family)